MVIDIKASGTRFLDGFGHEGMVNAARGVIRKSKKSISEAFGKYPGYKLTITGHSLGGGVAELITMKLLRNNDFPGKEIKCIAFGAPPIYHGHLDDRISNAIENWVHENDLIPRLSIYNVIKLLATARRIDQLNLR